jgi:uncharacterized protein with HEPN domain
MLADKRDVAHLWDMREAARDCIEFVADATYDEFCSNRMMHSAVERRLEVLGESGGRISEEFQLSHPEIPRKEIKGIRVVLAHRYGDVNLHQLWQTMQRDIPDLLPKLDKLIPSTENG